MNESGVDRERREYEDQGRTEGILRTSGGDEGRRTELTERTKLWGVRVRGGVRRRKDGRSGSWTSERGQTT